MVALPNPSSQFHPLPASPSAGATSSASESVGEYATTTLTALPPSPAFSSWQQDGTPTGTSDAASEGCDPTPIAQALQSSTTPDQQPEEPAPTDGASQPAHATPFARTSAPPSTSPMASAPSPALPASLLPHPQSVSPSAVPPPTAPSGRTKPEAPLPPHVEIAQADFLRDYRKSLVEEVARSAPPVYSGPGSVPSARLNLLKRKPLGAAQAMAIYAAACGIRGLRATRSDPGRRRDIGLGLVFEMGTGKTYCSLAALAMADEEVTRAPVPVHQRPEKASFFPAAVLSPPIMQEKWAREAELTLPDARVVILRPITTREEAAAFRRFDPTFPGGRLSAIGVTERVVARIRVDLARWSVTRDKALAAGKRPPAKPCHVVVISQSTAKFGMPWSPVYVLRVLRQQDDATGKIRVQRDPETRAWVTVPCCPSCFAPVAEDERHAAARERQTKKAAKKGQAAPSSGVARSEGGTDAVVVGDDEDLDDLIRNLPYLSEADLLGIGCPRVKRSCTACGEPLWQSVPEGDAWRATTPPIAPLQSPGESPGEGATIGSIDGMGEVEVLGYRSPESTTHRILPARRLRVLPLAAGGAGAGGGGEVGRHGPQRIQRAGSSTVSPTPSANRRYPIADYLRRRHKGVFRALIADEAHELSGAGTAQGYAAASLVDACNPAPTVLFLTGTLFTGYASAMFPMLWRLMPSLRKLFGYDEVSRWVQLYGIRQKTVKLDVTPGAQAGVRSKRREDVPRFRELPGISPLVLNLLLPHCLFLELADVAPDLPAYHEDVVLVPLGPQLKPIYTAFERESTDALRQQLLVGDNSGTSSWFHGLMIWPNLPTSEIVARSKRTGVELGRAEALPADAIYPKEQALLDLVRRERAEGRRVLIYVEHTGEHDIMPRLAQLLEADDVRWCAEDPDDHPARPINVVIMRGDTVSTTHREAWLAKQVAAGCDVLLCNSGLVKVGLDLLAFPTILVYEVIFSTTRWRQAIRRSWRPGQTVEVRVIQLTYEQTMEARGLQLIATKAISSLMVEGKMPSASLAAHADTNSTTNLIMELFGQVVAEAAQQEAEHAGAENIVQAVRDTFLQLGRVEQDAVGFIGEVEAIDALGEAYEDEDGDAVVDAIPSASHAASDTRGAADPVPLAGAVYSGALWTLDAPDAPGATLTAPATLSPITQSGNEATREQGNTPALLDAGLIASVPTASSVSTRPVSSAPAPSLLPRRTTWDELRAQLQADMEKRKAEKAEKAKKAARSARTTKGAKPAQSTSTLAGDSSTPGTSMEIALTPQLFIMDAIASGKTETCDDPMALAPTSGGQLLPSVLETPGVVYQDALGSPLHSAVVASALAAPLWGEGHAHLTREAKTIEPFAVAASDNLRLDEGAMQEDAMPGGAVVSLLPVTRSCDPGEPMCRQGATPPVVVANMAVQAPAAGPSGAGGEQRDWCAVHIPREEPDHGGESGRTHATVATTDEQMHGTHGKSVDGGASEPDAGAIAQLCLFM